jgi:predicted PurR-regulated permease PerM
MINEKTFKKLIVIASIALLLIMSFIIIWPIFLSIITGMLLAYVFHPVYKIVLKVVREKNISSAIILLLIIFILFIPLWFLFPVIARQAFDAYTYSQKIDISSAIGNLLPQSVSTDTAALINTFISKTISSLFTKFSSSALNITDLLLQVAVILFVFFFTLRDGDKLKEFTKDISPFSRSVEENLAKQFKDITNSVIFGHIIIGVIQGVLTGIGFYIFGVQNVLILTILAIFAAIIPIVGAWLIWIPASLYLLTSGHTGAGIGLFIYGAVIVSLIVDSVLRPYIVSKRANISSAIFLVGMIGGLIIFGIIGLVIGPLILSYLIILLEAYRNKKLGEFFSSD